MTIREPVFLRTELVHIAGSFTRHALNVTDLSRRQGLEIIIPPIKPSPKERRKLPIVHYRQHDIESLGGRDRFGELRQHGVGFVQKSAKVKLTTFEGSLQPTQLVYHHEAGNKERYFRLALQDCLLLLSLRGCFGCRFRHRLKPRYSMSLSSQKFGCLAMPNITYSG